MTARAIDIAIIGGGIAGASVGSFLANSGVQVHLFEMEDSLAYHTTGRSAALLTPYYGPDSMKAFATIGRSYLESESAQAEDPLIEPRDLLTVIDANQTLTVERPPNCVWWDESTCLEKVPFLRSGKFLGGIVDKEVFSIDVHALHSHYVRNITRKGGVIHLDSRIDSLNQDPSGFWELSTDGQSYKTPTVCNAAGAWGDELARIADIAPVGLVPKRRTVAILDSSQFPDVNFDIETFVVVEPNYVYFQNFGVGKLMLSAADQTPSVPCDAQPDEMDLAVAIARFEETTDLKVTRIDHSWAGLRTFAPDHNPVIGWEPHREGFFWLVGQGGYGIFSSPGIGCYAASLLSGSEPPNAYVQSPFEFSTLSPDRFRLT
ncbi:MAG: FAD-binding oxidoreductase [Acidiferrobacterales bacterium]|nr:FAD-binding oxidoreductase [Acidiferrobacterales bacterium]